MITRRSRRCCPPTAISRADLVIGVLTSERQFPSVLFELGQAYAHGRRIVLITSPRLDPIPFSLHQFLVLRIDLDNREAIEFALDQLLSAASKPKRAPSLQAITHAGLGAKADDLTATLERSLASRDWQALEQVVAAALRSSGADIIVASPKRDMGADFAVWSDRLEPFVGNPLLIEIKISIRSNAEANSAVQQLASYLGPSGSQWGLLLYGDGPDPEDQAWSDSPPNILVISLRSLFGALRARGFAEVVRDLRNRRVHGSSS